MRICEGIKTDHSGYTLPVPRHHRHSLFVLRRTPPSPLRDFTPTRDVVTAAMNRYALAVAADKNDGTDRGRDSGDYAANPGGEELVGVSAGTGGDEMCLWKWRADVIDWLIDLIVARWLIPEEHSSDHRIDVPKVAGAETLAEKKEGGSTCVYIYGNKQNEHTYEQKPHQLNRDKQIILAVRIIT